MTSLKVIGVGIMSGSSLDGVDLCCAEFTGCLDADRWQHRIINATTVPYSGVWREKLAAADTVSGEDLIKLHVDYGHYIGQLVDAFIEDNELNPDFAACHGHTIFHQPHRGFTFQMGDGETMVAYLKCPLVNNFRNKDVALGGQGAPLVPMGERFLFGQYDFCLNLGGISNVSHDAVGFDTSPCNMLLNYLSAVHDPHLQFDSEGKIAESGHVVDIVLSRLNELEFYHQAPPKSLGKEWFDDNMKPILDTQKYSASDLLRTAVEHICCQITSALAQQLENRPHVHATEMTLLATGGGALNTFLMKTLQDKLSNHNIRVQQADTDTIQYKEALIFAFLGVRCLLGLTNVGQGVTGASGDSVCGSIHLPTSCRPLPAIGGWLVATK